MNSRISQKSGNHRRHGRKNRPTKPRVRWNTRVRSVYVTTGPGPAIGFGNAAGFAVAGQAPPQHGTSADTATHRQDSPHEQGSLPLQVQAALSSTVNVGGAESERISKTVNMMRPFWLLSISEIDVVKVPELKVLLNMRIVD